MANLAVGKPLATGMPLAIGMPSHLKGKVPNHGKVEKKVASEHGKVIAKGGTPQQITYYFPLFGIYVQHIYIYITYIHTLNIHMHTYT